MINALNQENKKFKNNTIKIPKRHKSPVIYDVGVNNYVFNEIKKAKYQGAFDPGSLGNKNIFIDSNRTNNKNNSGINQQKVKKNNIQYNKLGEGKNLLIIKSETQYPLNYGYEALSPDLNYNQKSEKNIYNFNNYYIETRNNNYRNIFARSNDNKKNYFSPSNKERQKNYLLQNNNYLTKTINIEKLNKDFDKRFKAPKRTLYEKYSTNTISFNNPINNFSPTLAPKRNSNIFKPNIDYINMSYSKNFNNMNNNRNEIINNTYTFDDDNNFDNYILYDNSIDKIDINKDKEKIDFYRQKLLNLFFFHIRNFYRMHFKSLFNEIINILRTTTNNKERNFENKSIKNIAVLKKELKNNYYYYGQSGKVNNLIKEVKIKKIAKNILLENLNNNGDKDMNIANPKLLKNDVNIIENYEKKNYNQNDFNKKISSSNKVITRKKFIGNINNLNNTSNTKYMKKKISQGIYGKKIISQKFNNKLKLFDTNIKKEESNNNNDNIKTNETDKMIKNTPIIKKRIKFSKSFLIDKNFNSGLKIIDNNYLFDNDNNNNVNDNYIINNNIDNNFIETNENKLKNNIDEIELIKDKKIENKNEIDKNPNYIIHSQNEENNDENSELKSKENYPNKNLENEITLITKAIENKEKDDKEKKITILIQIINDKINKDKNSDSELIKKFFQILKQPKSDNIKEKKKTPKKLNIAKELIKKSKLKRNKKLKKNLVMSDLENSKENLDLNLEKNSYKSEDDDKDRTKRNKNKFRVIIRQIKIQKNISNYKQFENYRPKTPEKKYKNNSPALKINNKTPKIIIKKTLNIILSKNKAFNNYRKKGEIEKDIIETNKDVILKDKEYDGKNDIILKEKEQSEEILDNTEKNNEEKSIKNIEINEDNINIKNIEEKLEDKFNEDSAINNSSKLRNNNIKLSEIENIEINNEKYIDKQEKYDDCENFIFLLRAQLIGCFLSYNNEDSILD